MRGFTTWKGEPLTRREAEIARSAATRAWESAQGYMPGAVVDAIARAFPIPKVKRPRVLEDPHDADFRWRCVAGKHECRTPGGEWVSPIWGYLSTYTPERAALWADLLAKPEEEVDVE